MLLRLLVQQVAPDRLGPWPRALWTAPRPDSPPDRRPRTGRQTQARIATSTTTTSQFGTKALATISPLRLPRPPFGCLHVGYKGQYLPLAKEGAFPRLGAELGHSRLSGFDVQLLCGQRLKVQFALRALPGKGEYLVDVALVLHRQPGRRPRPRSAVGSGRF